MIKELKIKPIIELDLIEAEEFFLISSKLNPVKKYNFFFLYTLKKGKKLKVNNIFLRVRNLIKQVALIINYKFKKNLFDFKFLFLQKVLSSHFQIYLSKDFKTSHKKRVYFYVFLNKKNREKEVFKWLYYLTRLQSSDSFLLNFSWLVFDLYYYSGASEITAINSRILTDYKPKQFRKNLRRKKHRYLGLLMRL